MLFNVRNSILRSPEGDPVPPAGGGSKEDEKEPEQQDTVALAKAFKELKENSVPKDEFERLKKENQKLVNEVINGDGGAGSGQQTPPEESASIEELREKLYGPKCGELSNLEYWKNTLALRKAIMDKGETDPFLPVGAKISPNKEDVEKAQNVADVVQKCIDECEGNSEMFTALLQSRTNNDSPQLTMRLKKLGIK